MKRRLFLVPILCSLLLAGCGQGLKESPANAQPAAPESAATSTAAAMSPGDASPENAAAPGSPEASEPGATAVPSAPSGSDNGAGAAQTAQSGNDHDAGAAQSAQAGGDNDSGAAPSAQSGSSNDATAAQASSGTSQVAVKGGRADSGIVPAQLSIPAIGVKAKVLSLGMTKDGAMDVPRNGDDVGWFKPGYRPGIPGHAVIAGHVDTKTSAAVFYKLKDLKKGNKVIVRSQDGTEKVFKVIGSETYPYDKAPLKQIFGPSDRALLNLITCTGLYSRSKGTHQQRLVVTAELVS